MSGYRDSRDNPTGIACPVGDHLTRDNLSIRELSWWCRWWWSELPGQNPGWSTKGSTTN